jgi:hypothetical protein
MNRTRDMKYKLHLVGLLAFAWFIVGKMSWAQINVSQVSAALASHDMEFWADDDGDLKTPPRKVDGVVCDNLRDMKSDQLDFLTIKSNLFVGAQFENVTLSDTASVIPTTSGTLGFKAPQSDLGRCEKQHEQLLYYPPDEFNEIQEPAGVNQVTQAATRIVMLHVKLLMPNGERREIQQPIILARPPVVLVHGINSPPTRWNTFISAISTQSKNQGGLEIKIPFETLNHYDNLYGNGPVESAARQLQDAIVRSLKRVRQDAGSPASFGEYGNLKLSIRRVDVVAWSYGGVITRWYIASRGGTESRSWYKRKYSFDEEPPSYAGDIRKVITLGSMWRGVPLCNYVNEVLFCDEFPQPTKVKMSEAPVLPLRRVDAQLSTYYNKYKAHNWNQRMDNAKDLVDFIGRSIQVDVPSMEVMAINSPWLSQLVFGSPFPNNNSIAEPFDENIAYGSVAGDKSFYPVQMGSVSYPLHLYKFLWDIQRPSWFSGFEKEIRHGTDRTDTDGIVPVWSAAIPGSYKIAPTNHSLLAQDRDTQEYVVQWLNHAGLPKGSTLNQIWNNPEQSQIKSMEDKDHAIQTWSFLAPQMAPSDRNYLYPQIKGIGRLDPNSIGVHKIVPDNQRVYASVPQPSASPLYIGLVLDVSGSMNDLEGDANSQRKIERMKLAAQNAVESLDDNARIGVIAFSDGAQVKSTLAGDKTPKNSTSDKDAALSAIDALATQGGTNFAAGLRAAKEQFGPNNFTLISMNSSTPPNPAASNRRLIFMSDGQDNAEQNAVLGLAYDLKNMGVVIDTVALGFGERVNEARLQQISSITGGTHASADSYNIISVYNQLMARSQGHSLSSLALVALPPRKTAQWSIPVAAGSRRARFLVDWQRFDSRFGMELVSPSGHIAHGFDKGGISRLDFRQEKAFAAFTVDSPEPGTWTLRAHSQSQDEQLEFINMAVTEDNPVGLLMAPLRSHYDIVERVPFRIELRDRSGTHAIPIRGATVDVTVQSPDARERPVTVRLRESAPGVYEGGYSETWTRGLYRAQVRATGASQSAPFARQAQIDFLVGHIENPRGGSTLQDILRIFGGKK